MALLSYLLEITRVLLFICTFDVINWNEFKLQLKIEQKLMNLLSKLKSVFYNKHLMHPSVISELLHNYNLRFGMINVFKRENLDKHFEMSWWFHRMENQKKTNETRWHQINGSNAHEWKFFQFDGWNMN